MKITHSSLISEESIASQFFSYQTMGLRDLLETLSKSSEEPQRVGVREAVAEATTNGLSAMS